MKFPHSLSRSVVGYVEPLESRIAPAVIIVGQPDAIRNSKEINYNSPNGFVDTTTGTDQISQAVGGFMTATGQHETFYLKLKAGDLVQLYAGESQDLTNFISVSSGTAVAFFEDRNHDNEVQQNELVSISLGPSAAIGVQGNISGSIVSNLDSAGHIHTTDLVSSAQGIARITLGGSVAGSILGGGNIANVSLANTTGILAGTAALGKSYTVFPTLSDGSQAGTFTIAGLNSSNALLPTTGAAGGSLLNIVVEAAQTLQAGNGGVGGAGGSIVNLQVQQDVSAFQVLAGNGGNADASLGRPHGGAGGSIVGAYISGFGDLVTNELVTIHAGAGGNSVVGIGGAGGGIAKIYVGAALVGGKPIFSDAFSADDFSIQGGHGGSGRIGGAGGSLNTVFVTTTTPVDTNLAGKGLLHEIEVQAGIGGDSTDTVSTTNVRSGAGGSILNTSAINLAPQAVPFDANLSASTLLQAGSAGVVGLPMTGGPFGIGGAGGSIVNSSVLAGKVAVQAGDGASGLIGGAGGYLATVKLTDFPGVFVHVATVDAGNGGNGTVGNGGAGGAVATLTSTISDFASLLINQTGAKGGNSVSRLGGAGGLVTGLDILDGETETSEQNSIFIGGTMVLNSGHGGDGGLGGGAGGSISNSKFDSQNMSSVITSGDGGDALTSGNGGAGGAIVGLRVNLDGRLVGTTVVSSTVVSGNGGIGKVTGGAGGNISSLVVRVFDDLPVLGNTAPVDGGNATVIGGHGGSGGLAAAGTGASIVLSGVYAQTGSGSMIAGDAGAIGTRPAAGGTIRGTSLLALTGLYAEDSVTLQAGNGSNGGAGGSLIYVGFGSASSTLVPVPSGNILVKAGDGSAVNNLTGADYAGPGGSVIGLFGSVSGGSGTTTKVIAGQGGFAVGGSKVGAGGSINIASIERGPEDGVTGGVLTIVAGDGGDATSDVAQSLSLLGAAGGSVSNVVVRNIGDGTIFRSVAAGDGGAGTVKGGAGGSVVNVQVDSHDIGVRTGQIYGYASMGGVFAGKGGNGTTLAGLAGNVTQIGATGISAIAAGKSDVPELANTVAAIRLAGGGEATVLPASTGGLVDESFQLSYHPALQEAAPQVGTTQTFQRLPGGTSDLSRPTLPSFPQPPGGPTTFTLSYGGQTTTPLDANATEAEIEAALEALPAFAGVAVTVVDLGNGSFSVDSANQATQAITGVGTESTAPLKGTAVPAQVQAALAKLSMVADGVLYQGFPGARVISTETTSFQVTYNTAGAGLGDLTAERILNGQAIEITAGNFNTNEVQHIEVRGTGQFQILVPGYLTPTDKLNSDASAADVQTAIEKVVQGFVPITVAKSGLHGFDVTFNTLTDEQSLQTREFAPLAAKVVVPGSGSAMEVQTLDFAPLHGVNDLVFTVKNAGNDAANTIVVPANHFTSTAPTAAQVAAALNSLPAIMAVGSVTVNLTPANTFQVTFSNLAAVGNLDIVASEVLPATVVNAGNYAELTVSTQGTFTLSSGGTPTIPLSAHSSAAAVQVALDSIMTPGSVHVTADPAHYGTYQLAYSDPANPDVITVNNTLALNSSAPVGAVDSLTYARQVTFNDTTYAQSNIVGAIADINKLGAEKFAYIDLDGNGTFNLGDRAIDGLIAAKNFSQKTTNFIPQARLTVNTDALSPVAGRYLPVNPAAPSTPVFYDFANDTQL